MARVVKTRDETKEETRRALLEAGRQAFADEGLDLPSLDAICARAGYTRGAFYVHFKDRDDFLVEVMEQGLGEFLNAVLGTEEEGADLERTVDRFAEAIVQGAVPMLHSGALQFHQLLAATHRSPRLKERFGVLLGQAMGRMARAMKRAQGKGQARRGVAPEQVSAMLTATALGLVCMLETGIPFNPQALRKTVLAMLQADAEH